MRAAFIRLKDDIRAAFEGGVDLRAASILGNTVINF